MSALTSDQVHVARTAGLTDTSLARLWRRDVATVRNARVGVSWKTHPTPPDIAPRDATGRRTHGGLVKAKPARQRREWLR